MTLPPLSAPQELDGLLVPLLASILYVAYHYGAAAARIEERLPRRLPAERRQALSVMGQRLGGALLLGLVPALVLAGTLGDPLGRLGLVAPSPGSAGAHLVALGLVLLLLPILWLASGSAAHQERYPQVRARRWGRGLVLANAASWAIYLLAYEAFFRGLILFALVAGLGLWPGIGVATALYVYAHLPKDAGETTGCILMGCVFSALAVATGAIWAPLLLHLGVALASDTFARWRSPASSAAPALERVPA